MTPLLPAPTILPAPGAKPLSPVSPAQATAQPDSMGDIQDVPLHDDSADRKPPPSSTPVIQELEIVDPSLRPFSHSPESISGDSYFEHAPSIRPSPTITKAKIIPPVNEQYQEELQKFTSIWPFHIVAQEARSPISTALLISQTRPSTGNPQIVHLHQPVEIRPGDMGDLLGTSAMAGSPSKKPTPSWTSQNSDADNSMLTLTPWDLALKSSSTLRLLEVHGNTLTEDGSILKIGNQNMAFQSGDLYIGSRVVSVPPCLFTDSQLEVVTSSVLPTREPIVGSGSDLFSSGSKRHSSWSEVQYASPTPSGKQSSQSSIAQDGLQAGGTTSLGVTFKVYLRLHLSFTLGLLLLQYI